MTMMVMTARPMITSESTSPKPERPRGRGLVGAGAAGTDII